MDFSIIPKFKFEIFFFQASSDDDKKDYTNLEKIQKFCRRFCTFIKGRFSRPESEVKVQGGRHLWKSDSGAYWVTWLNSFEMTTYMYSYLDDIFHYNITPLIPSEISRENARAWVSMDDFK